MKNRIFYLILFFVIIGCNQPTLDKIQKAAQRQAELLVDCGLVQNKYIILNEVAINKNYHIYLITDSEFPFAATLESPSKIIPYKNSFICLLELDEQKMSIAEIKKKTGYLGNPMIEIDDLPKWCLAVSTNGKRRKIIELSELENSKSWFDMVELWPYLSGYVKDNPIQMGIMTYNIRLKQGCILTSHTDSIKKQLLAHNAQNIDCIFGDIYLKNNTDSCINLSSNREEMYAIVYDKDSLFLSLTDSLPIEIAPYQSVIVSYRSLPHQTNNHFFEKLATKEDSWTLLHNLFCSSTYCIMNINEEKTGYQIMFQDIGNYEFEVFNPLNQKLTMIYLPYIYDKDENIYQNTRFWYNEWNNRTDAEREKIENKVEKKMYERKKREMVQRTYLN